MGDQKLTLDITERYDLPYEFGNGTMMPIATGTVPICSAMSCEKKLNRAINPV